MAADHRTSTMDEGEAPRLSFGAAQIVGLLLLVVASIAAACLIQNAVPVIVAGGTAALMPRRHGWRVRVPLALIVGLLTLFAFRFSPDDLDIGDPAAEQGSAALSWLIGLPMAGALAVLFMPRQSKTVLRWTTLGIMLATLAATVPILRVEMGSGYHFNQDIVWLARFGIHYHVAVDGISLWLVILTAFMVPIAAYASFGSIESRIKDWCFALLLLEGAMIGAFCSLDLFLFYVFWELMLIPMYVMIGVWGGANRVKAAIKFFLYTMFGSVLMLAAILYLAYTYSKLSPTHQLSFDYFELQRVVAPKHVQMWLWAAFTLSFVIKVPMFPVHTWLPDAHTEAPTAGSVILAAVMLKLGTYGYLRFSMGLFPQAAAGAAPYIGGIAVLGGIIYGALCAWKQDDVKRLVAYSSVAHLGYVMLGLAACTTASIEGAVLQMVNHGISTGALFLLVGVIYDRRHTRQVDEFGGLAKSMPVFAALFIVATLASIGLPGTNGFIGEFMIITGTFASNGTEMVGGLGPVGKLNHFNGIQAVGAAIGVILGALYMLSVVQKMFFGPITKKVNKTLSDVNGRELVALAPLVFVIFLIGLFPNLFLGQIRRAAERVQTELSQSWGSYMSADAKHRVGTQSAPLPDDWDSDRGFVLRLEPRHASAPPLAIVAAQPKGSAQQQTDE